MEQEVVVESSGSIAVENPILRYVVHASQLSIYPLLLIVRLIIVRDKLYRNTARLTEDTDEGKATYVLYANHQSKLDPLIICASLPFNTIRKLLPFRFFVANSYFKGLLAKRFLYTMGGFQAHYVEDKTYGLDRARALMGSSQTIVIFPPGMRTRQHIAKPGISMLSVESNTYLIPVLIDWKHRWHCHVHIGVPFKAEPTQPPEQLMQRVYELHSQTS